MKCLAVIPVRFASTRLPGKPLLRETGKYLVQHVYENVQKVPGIDRVIVATDDQRIARAAREFGAEAWMTSRRHPSGTDRVAEVARKVACDVVLNVQGDEPELPRFVLQKLVLAFRDPVVRMATLATPWESSGPNGRPARRFRGPARRFRRPARRFRRPASGSPEKSSSLPRGLLREDAVKVVFNRRGDALYFSRAPIPWKRHSAGTQVAEGTLWHRHIGVYGYRRVTLLDLVGRKPTRLERCEKLEQLRALEHGIPIRVVVVSHLAGRGIDTAEDYRNFVTRFSALEKGPYD